jgi:lysophospholipase
MSASGSAPAPYFDDVAEGPADAAAFWLTTCDGRRIRVAQWGAQAPRGTVLLFPGRTEYVEKYGRTAQDLLARGLATLTVDWRGQGLADRLLPRHRLGHVDRFTDYQHDVAAMLDHARRARLPAPFFLLAHSMGGAIGLRALLRGLPVQAAAFSAPMWGIRMKGALRPVVWTLSTASRPLRMGHWLAPGQTEEAYLVNGAFAGNTLTSDPEMYAYMQRQIRSHPELALGGPSLRWLNESLREMRALMAAQAPRVPTVTFIGTDEAIVDPARIEARMARWPGGRTITLPGARHEVLMERPATRTRAIDEIVAHFAKHAARGAAPA